MKPFVALIFFLNVPAALAAQERTPDGWNIGAIIAADSNPYIGQSADVVPIPLISYRSGPLSIGTNGLGYRFIQTGPWDVTVAARPRFSGLISTDGALLDGIDRQVTGDLALEARYDIGVYYASFDLRQEFTGEHDGQELRFGVGTRTRVGRVGLDLGAGAFWQNDDLSRYIWGVSPSETAIGRPAYAPGYVIVPYVSLRARLPLSGNWSLLGTVRVDFLNSDISSSPIIEDDQLFSGALGISYSF